MKLYQILFLSLLIIFPYLIIQNEFYSYSYLLLSKILNKKLNEKAIEILAICYIILFYIILLISFFQIFLFEIFAGILTIFNALLFYKPIFTERNKIISYFPSLDILYVFFLGIFIFTKGIIKIIEKIKKKHNRLTVDIYSDNLLNESFNQENNYTKINKTTIELTANNLAEYIAYFLKIKQNDFGIYNFSNFFLDIKFIDSITIETTIKNFYMENEKLNVKIKNFEGIFNLIENKIKTKVIKKGDIFDLTSCVKSFLIRIFKNTSLIKDKIDETLNNYLSKGNFVYDDTFEVFYSIGNIKIIKEILNITLEASIKKKFCRKNDIIHEYY